MFMIATQFNSQTYHMMARRDRRAPEGAMLFVPDLRTVAICALIAASTQEYTNKDHTPPGRGMTAYSNAPYA
jgi:hypothetical protein